MNIREICRNAIISLYSKAIFWRFGYLVWKGELLIDNASVYAIVVTYNRAGLLRQCLDGLLAQTYPVNTILVIDNASSDGTPDILAEEYPQVKCVRLNQNTGASGGFEAGFRKALESSWDWLWVLDDDIKPWEGCLQELLRISAESNKKVVVPRRRALTGVYPRHEAVINERAQAYAPPERDSDWSAVDIFTFEGPLIQRDVVENVGVPNKRFFIIADDTEYAVRVYKKIGPEAAALANNTAVDRLLRQPSPLVVKSRVKGLLTGSDEVMIESDEQHWKRGYYLRNRHLIWRQLGWKRRRIRQILMHFVYLFTDLRVAVRNGWNWKIRLDVNLKSFWLGLRGKDGVFVHPADYHERLAKGKEVTKS